MTVREMSNLFSKDAVFDIEYANGAHIKVNNDKRRFKKYLDYFVVSEIVILDDGVMSFICRETKEEYNESAEYAES